MATLRPAGLALLLLAALPAAAGARRLPRPACLPGEGPPRLLRLQDGALEQCLEDEANDTVHCFAIALTGGQLQTIATPPHDEPMPRIAHPPAAMKLELGEGSVEICRANGSACKTIRASAEVDPGLGLSAEINAAGTVVALAYLGDDTTVETFEIATGKRLAQLRGRGKDAMCIHADFVGESLLIRERECGSDGVQRSWLASAAGTRLAETGGSKAFASPLEPAHVAGDEWAFVSAKGDAIAIQDVKTGKVRRRISVGRAAKGTPAAILGDGRRLVLVYQASRLGEVTVVELPSFKVTRHAARRCPES